VRDGADVEEGVEEADVMQEAEKVDVVEGPIVLTIRSFRVNYEAFGFETATDVDQLAEKVSFLFLKLNER